MKHRIHPNLDLNLFETENLLYNYGNSRDKNNTAREQGIMFATECFPSFEITRIVNAFKSTLRFFLVLGFRVLASRDFG